ncbi:MAG: PfkB family carbohydrate kinase [Anaerolineae bacterium]|nr:PfkB family carbohydrate kinase [Anaerolineae bacterium]
MPNIDYLLIGHLTADIVKEGRLLGGTVSYAAPIAKLFGHRVGLLSSAAVGEDLVEPLLSVADVSIRLAKDTTTFSNIYEESKRTQYVHAHAAKLSYDMIPVGWLDTPLLHLAPLVEEVDTSIARRFPDATVLLTPQGYLRRWDADKRVHFKRWLDKDMLSHVDILIFSKADIADAPDLEAEFAQASEHVIVTDGDKGGIYYHKGEAIPYASYPVEEVEPTGAGDVFAASLLASLPKVNHDMNAALKVAARLAGISVTRLGTRDTVSADEVQTALDAIQEK